MTTKTVKLDQICVTTYVRSSASEERITMFMDLYTAADAGPIPPLEITQENKLIDGRHRLMAMLRLEVAEAECVVTQVHDELELVMRAIKANMGGSKELSWNEVLKTIIDLLVAGHSARRIRAGLPFPKSIGKKMYDAAVRRWERQRITAAAAAVSGGEPVEKAAAFFRVEVADVECKLRHKTEPDEFTTPNTGQWKGALTQRYYGLTKRNNTSYKKMIAQYESGVINEDQLREVWDHLLHQAKVHIRAMEDVRDRMYVHFKTRRPLMPAAIKNEEHEIASV